jgi:hypothetical protein
MASDLENFKAMLTRADVSFEDAELDERIDGAAKAIEVRGGGGSGNPMGLGYSSSFAILHFDDQGALISWSNWEGG